MQKAAKAYSAPTTSGMPHAPAMQTGHTHDGGDRGSGHGGLHLDVSNMQQALTVIFGPDEGAPMAVREKLALGVPGATRFQRIEVETVK